GVIEAWEQQLPLGIQDFSLRSVPSVHLGGAAHGDDSLPHHGQGLSLRTRFVHSPYLGVGNDQVSRRLALRQRNCRTEQCARGTKEGSAAKVFDDTHPIAPRFPITRSPDLPYLSPHLSLVRRTSKNVRVGNLKSVTLKSDFLHSTMSPSSSG